MSVEKMCRCAGIIIFRENGDILLVAGRSKKYPYSIPKGKREEGESTPETARREVLEETGLRPTDYELIPHYQYFEYNRRTNAPHIIYYLAKLKNTQAILRPINPREIKFVGWFSPDKIQSLQNFYYDGRRLVGRASLDISKLNNIKVREGGV